MPFRTKPYQTGKDNKLPLICPIVVYANDQPYTAPRSFWELFEDSKTAKD
ncbi:Rpn family recombination-promoting nuclease/putative transposase [Rickettsia endosymbiont of Ixodes pacificus]